MNAIFVPSGDGGIWDTNGGTGFWTLGAATTLDAVNFTVAPGESFIVFASDWFSGAPFPNGLFFPGKQFTLTIGSSDGSSATVNTVIPPATGPAFASLPGG